MAVLLQGRGNAEPTCKEAQGCWSHQTAQVMQRGTGSILMLGCLAGSCSYRPVLLACQQRPAAHLSVGGTHEEQSYLRGFEEVPWPLVAVVPHHLHRCDEVLPHLPLEGAWVLLLFSIDVKVLQGLLWLTVLIVV